MEMSPQDGTNTETQNSNPPKKLEGDELLSALKKQLLYYFSKDNLQTDNFLMNQMNSDYYVPIKTIAGFNMVRNLTEDIELIVKVLRSTPDVVSVDEDGKMVKPVYFTRPQRTTLMFREMPHDTTKEEIEEFFNTNGCSQPSSIKSEIAQTWFISFTSEEEAMKTFEIVRNLKFKGQIIQVRYKSEHNKMQLQTKPVTFPSFPQVYPHPNWNTGYKNPGGDKRRNNPRVHPRKEFTGQKQPNPRREGEQTQQNNVNPQTAGAVPQPSTQPLASQSHNQNTPSQNPPTISNHQPSHQIPTHQAPTQRDSNNQGHHRSHPNHNHSHNPEGQEYKRNKGPRNPKERGSRAEAKPQPPPVNIDSTSFPPLPGGPQKNESPTNGQPAPKQTYSLVAVAVADKPVVIRQDRRKKENVEPNETKKVDGQEKEREKEKEKEKPNKGRRQPDRSNRGKRDSNREDDKENQTQRSEKVEKIDKGEKVEKVEKVEKMDKVEEKKADEKKEDIEKKETASTEKTDKSTLSYAQILKSMNSSTPTSSVEKLDTSTTNVVQEKAEKQTQNSSIPANKDGGRDQREGKEGRERREQRNPRSGSRNDGQRDNRNHRNRNDTRPNRPPRPQESQRSSEVTQESS